MTAYENQLEAIRAKRQANRDSANEIGDIPKQTEKQLWEECRYDLVRFLQSAFPNSTGLKPFSVEQLAAIKNMQDVILGGGMKVQAWPRGYGKTTCTERAAIWATAYGHRKYVVIYSAGKALADLILESIKSELQSNKVLYAMFPWLCYPIAKLENASIRAKKQTHNGEPTNIGWGADGISFPTNPTFDGSAATIESKAVKASRGIKAINKESGEVARPDLMLFDDPQTDEDAENPNTVAKISRTIVRSCIMGGGHSDDTTAIMNCTVIEDDDVAETFLNDPNWVAVRFKMMKSMPVHLDDMWLEKYADIRRGFDKESQESRTRAMKAALTYYKRHQIQMDEGAEATWDWGYKWKSKNGFEITAIQHAMNILIDFGWDVFLHECQNQTHDEHEEMGRLTWRSPFAKVVDSLPRDVVPSTATTITGHIDVQESVLSYALVAWDDYMSGHVIRYGTYPDQRRLAFEFRKAKKRLIDAAPKNADMDGAIFDALIKLVDEIFKAKFETQAGVDMKVDGLAIDAGYATEVVKQACLQSPHAALLVPMKGRGIKPTERRLSEWKLATGAKRGEEWIYQRPVKRDVRQITFDTNYWKSKVKEAWLAPAGNKFSLSLHAGSREVHKMFCNHQSAERVKAVSNEGRTSDIWTLPPNKPDNHFFDNVVGSMVMASFKGVARPVHRSAKKPRRSRPKQRISM